VRERVVERERESVCMCVCVCEQPLLVSVCGYASEKKDQRERGVGQRR